MVNGQVLLHSFTIVDGWRVQDLLEALRRNPDIVATCRRGACNRHGEARSTGHRSRRASSCRRPIASSSGTTDVDLLRQAHAALEQELEAAWTDRDPRSAAAQRR